MKVRNFVRNNKTRGNIGTAEFSDRVTYYVGKSYSGQYYLGDRCDGGPSEDEDTKNERSKALSSSFRNGLYGLYW